jgi:hypothetical protein
MKFPECKYKETEMDLAIAERLDVGFEDHGWFVLFGGFSYGSSGQGIGLTMSSDFLKRFIRAFGVDTLQECNGRQIFVEHSNEMIHRLIPVSFDNAADEPADFDIFEWSKSQTVTLPDKKSKGVSKNLPITVCCKCGHWTVGCGKVAHRCAKCESLQSLLIETPTQLSMIRSERLDNGGMI